jgi:hypothetical protein
MRLLNSKSEESNIEALPCTTQGKADHTIKSPVVTLWVALLVTTEGTV